MFLEFAYIKSSNQFCIFFNGQDIQIIFEIYFISIGRIVGMWMHGSIHFIQEYQVYTKKANCNDSVYIFVCSLVLYRYCKVVVIFNLNLS